MKERKIYECEVCRSIYSERRKAQLCEAIHKTKLQIKECRYNPYSENENGFPITITVVDDNGNSQIYMR